MEEILQAIKERVEQLLELEAYNELQELLDDMNISDVAELVEELSDHEATIIDTMSLNRALNVFRILEFPTQEQIIQELPPSKVAELINELPPDDRTALLGELPSEAVKELIKLLNPEERKITLALLGYPEDSVGRLMTPDYISVRENWTVARVLEHIRQNGKDSETIDVIYVVDGKGKLLDDFRIREFLLVEPEVLVKELMDNRFIALNVNEHQDEVINIFRMNNRVALPVIDSAEILLGIVTVDDVLWMANEEYTEDIQKIGGTEALDEPYLDIPLFRLVKKRVGWLIILFIGEMLTATALGFFQDEIQKAAVLALFMPLIISSGGNSGSQASTLIIQAMALGEVSLMDWWRVMRREILSGLLLGAMLGVIGFCRIFLWTFFTDIYGPHWVLVGFTVGCSLIGVVLWGTLTGSMLPIIIRKLGGDPATSSAPFVATMVDVTGLIIYFTVAYMLMRGVLL